jgi:hypothetical protein
MTLPAATATAAAATTATTAAATAALVERLVDAQRAATVVTAIQLSDRLVGIRPVHLDEPEPARTSSLSVIYDRRGLYGAVGSKELSQIIVCRGPREIANINLLHELTPCPVWEPKFSSRAHARPPLLLIREAKIISTDSSVERVLPGSERTNRQESIVDA